MFVPVTCTSCQKPFQVPEAALGKLAPCPWCGAVVTALPVSAPIAEPGQRPQQAPPPPPPQSQRAPAANQSQPIPAAQTALSLDDAEPARPEAPRGRSSLPFTILIGVWVVVVVTAATLAYRHYGSGRLPESGWAEFAAPDGSFSIELPGRPTGEDVAANPGGSVTGGRRFTVRGWYSKTTAWVAYNDLDPALVPKFKADTDWVIGAGVLLAERERERVRLDGTVAGEVLIRLNAARGVEVQMDTPRGRAVLWIVLVHEGSRPRVYVIGAEGREVTIKSAAARRLFDTFRLTN